MTYYLVFILDYRNDVRQKEKLSDFLFEFKMVIKQQRQLTSTMRLAQKLLMHVECSGYSRSFAKETRALKMRSAVADHRKLTTTNWEGHWSRSSYNYMKSCPRTQRWHSMVVWHLKQAGKVKRLTMQVPCSWLKIKNCHFEVSSLILCNNNEPFLHQIVMCDRWIYMTTSKDQTTSDDQLSGWTEKRLQRTSQSQTCTKKRSWSLVVCCPFDPLQLSESWWNHYIRDVCSANWWDALKTAKPQPALLNRKARSVVFSITPPDCTLHSQHFKSWMNWATKFCLICHIHLTSHQLTSTFQAAWQFFAGKMLPQAGCKKMLSKSLESWSMLQK